MRRLRGLTELVVDATVHGSKAIERIQKEKARVPFEILESIPMTAAPAKIVHVVHDASVTATHLTIRAIATGVGFVAGRVLGAMDEGATPPSGPADPP